MNHEPLRYAHEEGHTDVCYSTDGQKFITCGTEGDIRIWSVSEGEDPIHSCIGEWACSVRQKDNSIYVATGYNEVQILTYPQGERNGVLDRFTAPINQIATSRDSEHIALAGEDMEVKLIDLGNTDKKVQVFDGLTGPCLSVAVNSKFLAASSGDGKLRVWSIDDNKLLKEIDCFPKVNGFANAKSLCRLDFQPVAGKYLAYPFNETVILLTTSNWSQSATLTCDQTSSPYSIVQFSPCGSYLVATTLQGDFVVFNVNTEKVDGVSKHPNSSLISGLMWNPLGNGQIVYTDVEGQLGIISGCILNSTLTTQDDDLFTDNAVDFGDIQFDDDDDDENVISVEKIKKQVMGDEESEINFGDRLSAVQTPRPRTPEIPLQPPFMPSSTPEHLNPRYLCWNDVGIIKSYGSLTDDDSGKSIEVEFQDSTFHNSIILQNYQDYTLGCLSKTAVVVANAKQIYVIPLSKNSKEWLLKLDEGPEEIILISTSQSLICLGTTNYLVRICSIFGTQMGVLAIPGPLVSMTSHGNTVAAAYHSGGIRRGDQCIDIKLMKFMGLTVECCDLKTALGPESTLSWLGFTDLGTPAMADSRGIVSVHPMRCNIWLPICDTTRQLTNPSDGFFVTAIIESHQILTGIKCRGGVYPSLTPKPTMCELKFESPFLETSTEKSQLETNLFMWSNLQIKDMEKRYTENGLKTFVLACKNNLDQRALELMEILSNPQLLNLGTSYAAKLNKKMLAEKLMQLAVGLQNQVEDDPVNVTVPQIKDESKRAPLSIIKRSAKVAKLTPQYEVSSPTQETQSDVSDLENTFTEEEICNPFAKKSETFSDKNPLSLVNKFAGVKYIGNKESKGKTEEQTEKRKKPETETEKQREKQRKLDRFMFKKS